MKSSFYIAEIEIKEMIIKKGFSMKTFLKILGVAGLISTVNAATETPIGYWRTQEGKAKVEIYECGNKAVCGKIIALKEPLDEQGKAKVDPQGKPILGMEIMKNFKHAEGNEWSEGSLYDPKEGKTYDATFDLQKGGKTMDLRGYVVISLIGRTQTWQRINKDDQLK